METQKPPLPAELSVEEHPGRDTTQDDIAYVYINNTRVAISNWDVRFVFSESLPSQKVMSRFGVVMSHQHAKALLESLAGTIASIEAIMGEIKVKPTSLSQGDTKSR